MNEWEKRIEALEKENAELKRQLEDRQEGITIKFETPSAEDFQANADVIKTALRESLQQFDRRKA